MEESFDFMHGMTIKRYLLTMLWGIVPVLLFNIAGTILVYNLLLPRFPASSIIPLLVASLIPILSNLISVVYHRRLDVIGMMVLIGFAISGVAALLGGDPQVLLIRESFSSGATGLVLLASVVLSRPLGYYFARQLLTANASERMAGFLALCKLPVFQSFLQRGTLFWGLLLLGEFIVRVVLVYTLPVMLVLTIAPVASQACMMTGLVVSALWIRSIVARIRAMKLSAGPAPSAPPLH